MVRLNFWRKGKSAHHQRVGVAMSPQGIVAVRVDMPFSSRPKIEAGVFRAQSSEADWPSCFAEIAKTLSAEQLPTVVVLHAQLVYMLQLPIPDIPPSERAQALKFRARELSPIPIEDMVLDYVEIQGMRSRGPEPMGYCAIARLSQMRAFRDAILGAGMKLEAIDVRDMALRHILARIQGEGNAAFLFVDQEESRIIVASGQLFYILRSSTVGASNIQRSLAGGDGLDRISESLLLDIQRTLDFYDSNFTDPPPRQVVVAPSWPFMPDLTEKLKNQMRLPLVELKLEDHIEGMDKIEGFPPNLTTLAVGAVLRPLDEGPVK